MDKSEILEYLREDNRLAKLIKKCRGEYLKTIGKEQRSNFTAKGSSIEELMKFLIVELMNCGCNQFTMTNIALSKVMGCDTTDLSTKMRNMFKGYGLGDYVSTGKSRFSIFKKIDKDGRVTDFKIKRDAHYTFYISKEFLDLMEEEGILIDILNYNKLRKDISSTGELMRQIISKSTVQVYITQYVGEFTSLDTYIKINKDFIKQEGSFEKSRYVTYEDERGNTISKEIENRSNDFTPRADRKFLVVNRVKFSD